MPLGFLVFKASTAPADLIEHLFETMVWEATVGSFLLIGGVLIGSGILGVTSAYLLARYRFPAHRLWEWVLLLPLALPAYVSAFVWLSLFDFSGDFSRLMREVFPFWDWNLGIRSMGGLIVVLSLSLYPYVYLSCLEGFKRQSRSFLESSLSLGVSRGQIWRRVEMPMILPWIFGALLLVGMETLADFGAASVFNASVFTTLVYRSWFGLQSLETASFLSVVHVLSLALFTMLFLYLSSKKKYWDQNMGQDRWPQKKLIGIQAWAASGFCALVFFLAFFMPVLRLLFWALEDPGVMFEARVLERLYNSLSLGFWTVVVLLLFSALFVFAKVILKSSKVSHIMQLSALGYGIPGTVLAVGWMVVANKMDVLSQAPVQLTLIALILALSTRFYALLQKPIDSSLQQLDPSIEDSMKILGVPWWRRMSQSYLPLLKGALLTGAIFVFVDTIKEMPMTLMLRPYGWESLSLRVYQFTSEGLWESAAAPSLWIVLSSILPVWWLKKRLV